MSKTVQWAGCLVILAATTFCPVARAAERILTGHVPAAVARLSPEGRLAAATRLDLAIGLPLRNQGALGSLLHDLYDPASTNYHRFLTPEQFTAQFGPTEQDYEAAAEFARTNGLTVTHRHGNRMLLDVNGNVADIERAFRVTLRTYRHPVEPRNFFAPDTDPSVDARLHVLDISGLSDFAKPTPMLHQKPTSGGVQDAAGSGPGNGYMGSDFRNAYAPGTTLDGFGQMVGLVQFDGYDPNDIFAHEAQAGLPNVLLQNVLIDGFGGTRGPNNEEVCLDIETAISMAPNLAAVVVFQAPPSSVYFNDILSAMVASNQIKQLSSSWGFSVSPSQTTDQFFQQMAAQGQSFFQASGDGDAWTSPIWQPGESTNLTVVGGTTLSMNGAGSSYLGETVWNWGNISKVWGPNGGTNFYWGSGGGVSTSYPIPYWQTNINMTTNLGSTTMRNIPDVALTADNIYVTYGGGSHALFGGTSCAAPLWAGFMALVNQAAAGMNKPPGGFINPAIYALGNSTNYTACFNDITTGSNTWSGSPNLYFAVPGYDLCTGLGTPAGTNFINALSGAPDALVIVPLAGFVAYGAAGGPFTGTQQTFTLNNPGAGPLSWNLVNVPAWLTFSPAGGTLTAGSQTNVTVSLAPAANALAAGIYNAAILFTNRTTGIAQPRIFTLQAGQSLVMDGGFESGTLSRWTLFGNTISGNFISDAVLSPLGPDHFDVAHSGVYGAFLGDNPMAVLAQVLPTIPGQKYLLSFWLDNPVTGPNQFFEVNWNTNAPATNTVFSWTLPPVFTWTNFNFIVTATTTNTTLQFGARNPPNFFGLDEVAVTPIPAPTFSSVTRTTDGVSFAWKTLTNVTYVVQYKTNLLQPNWLNLGGIITATNSTQTLLDTNALNASLQRFYRVSVTP